MKESKMRFRHELKYCISYIEYVTLRNVVKVLLKRDSNALEQLDYTVSSLYFDDFTDSAVYEKEYGVQNRDKYRIRIYNGNDSLIRLERKSKREQYTNKTSCILTREEYDNIISGKSGFWGCSNKPLLQELYLRMQSVYMRPKVIVEYDREAYISNVSEVRITFDKALRAITNSTDLFSKENTSLSILEDQQVILEVKYNEFLPDYLRTSLSSVNKQSLSMSKYVLCRQKINYIKGV